MLLAARHAAHVRKEPLLAPRFAEPSHAEQELAELWSRPGSSGAVATLGGEFLGYLLGAPKNSELWGPNSWVEAAGCAVSGEAEILRDLYGLAAARWADEGRVAHYALAPVSDHDIVDAWFRLGFGLQHVHAIRDVPAGVVHESAPASSNFHVRRATQADVPHLAALDLVLPEHQSLSPVFSATPIPTLEEACAEWQETLDDESFANFVAERNGIVLGSAVGCSVEKSSSHIGLSRPDNAGFLGFAAVLPSARGVGIGAALGQAVLTWAGEAGWRSVVTDWRSANLLSSRTWPKLGFRPTFLRLHRVIGY